MDRIRAAMDRMRYKFRTDGQTSHFYLYIAFCTIITIFRLTWDFIETTVAEPKQSRLDTLAELTILLLLVWLLVSTIRKARFYIRAEDLGCGPVAVYPHWDRILGLDLFFAALPRLRSHSALQWFSERLNRYGRTHWHLALGQWVIMTDEPENIKTILATKFDDWPIGGPRLLGVAPILGLTGIFTTNGEAWRHNRAMLRPAFVRDQVADLESFEKHTSNMIQRIPTDGSTFDMQRLLQDMTMDSSTDFLLGYSTNMLTDDPAPGAEEFIRAFVDASEESTKLARISPLLFKLPHPKLDANVKIIRDFVDFYLQKAVAERWQRRERGEPARLSYVLLDELLELGASQEHLMDHVLSVLLAGRDTTAVAITACFWYLARHPDAVKKLRKEILSVGAQSPTWEELKGMKYLNNVIKESLRLVPPVPTNSRTANKDTVLPRGGGPDGELPILVPKGQAVRFSVFSMHRRTDIYGPDAEFFRPERFETLHPGWEYIPFQGGPRICLGQQFALTQIAYVLYRVFQRFEAIEARDDDVLRLQPSLTSSFAFGCRVAMTPA